MNEVHRIAGSLEVRMNLAVMQENKPAFKGDWVEDWAKLKRSLLAKFSSTSNSTRQRQAFDPNKGRARQPWFIKALTTQKPQIVQQSRKLAKATFRGKHGKKLSLWAMKKTTGLEVGPSGATRRDSGDRKGDSDRAVLCHLLEQVHLLRSLSAKNQSGLEEGAVKNAKTSGTKGERDCAKPKEVEDFSLRTPNKEEDGNQPRKDVTTGLDVSQETGNEEWWTPPKDAGRPTRTESCGIPGDWEKGEEHY
ncbi:hypothetical protein NDU88_003050 [Pleurodeles waltl]|uniref:Uncharacterized protein n=1 Tax=Pleurodeles waltl TaxID=8319 RepID=A0AAV7M497_PLEWA|nr:hypothetical protein NDU88_003050 [Pleurodeles waltl]